MSAAGERRGAGRPDGERATAELLSTGEIGIKGRVPWSSNATFVVGVAGGGGQDEVLAIYKPGRGERPLWDFERGLWRREVAAYELSKHLGWGLVPLTVARQDAPLGPGSVQLFIDACADEHYFTLLEDRSHHPQLRRMAAFDLVANNADRKSGHCLLGPGGRVWAIDHGLTFHPEPKLRTVIWDFAGERVDDEVLADLGALAGGELPESFDRLLTEEESAAVVERAATLVRRRKFPRPLGEFPYPWPLV